MEQQADKREKFDKLKSYLEETLPGFIEKCQTNPQFDKNQKCPRLISLLGFSPATTVLATAALQPQELVVITSEKALKKGDYALAEAMIKEFKLLKNSRVKYESVDILDPQRIYAVVAENAKGKNVLVDITGGTKIMTAAAAQAAWENNAQSCYIHSEFGESKELPIPGTEQMLLLENPSEAKGKKLREKGLQAWELRYFTQAKDAFNESMNLSSDPSFEDIAVPLCEFYDDLFNFKVDNLKESLLKVSSLQNKKSLHKLLQKIDLPGLVKPFNAEEPMKDPMTKIALFLFLSQEYSRLGRYDFAGLLSYRTIEEIVVEGLRKLSKDGTFNRKCPAWGSLAKDVDKLQNDFSNLCSKLDKGKNTSRTLPLKIGLGDGYALLLLLDHDRYCIDFDNPPKLHKRPENVLRRIAGICDCRNESILAHGDAPLGEEKYQKILNLAQSISKIITENDIITPIPKIALPDLKALLQ